MRKDTSAGIIAGAVSGFLFPVMAFVQIGWSIATHLDDLPLAATRLNLSPQMVIPMLIVGVVFLCLAGAGLGAIIGLVFAKFANRLPMRSVYGKAFILACVLGSVVSLPRLLAGGVPDVYLLFPVAIDAGAFGFLFKRWTRKP